MHERHKKSFKTGQVARVRHPHRRKEATEHEQACDGRATNRGNRQRAQVERHVREEVHSRLLFCDAVAHTRGSLRCAEFVFGGRALEGTQAEER